MGVLYHKMENYSAEKINAVKHFKIISVGAVTLAATMIDSIHLETLLELSMKGNADTF